MEIRPTRVTFEQAKLLKEKGFNETLNVYVVEGNIYEYVEGGFLKNEYGYVTAPEQWQVVEWLRINHKIFIEISRLLVNRKSTFSFYIGTGFDSKDKESKSEFDTPQEAYSAAFDYVLINLI